RWPSAASGSRCSCGSSARVRCCRWASRRCRRPSRTGGTERRAARAAPGPSRIDGLRTMTDTHHPPQDPRLVGPETSDAEIGPLLKFAVFLTIVVVIVSLLTMGLYSYLDAREQAEKAPRYPLSTAQRPLPPTPRLQTHPFMDVQQLRREEARFLTRYSWVDRARSE